MYLFLQKLLYLHLYSFDFVFQVTFPYFNQGPQRRVAMFDHLHSKCKNLCIFVLSLVEMLLEYRCQPYQIFIFKSNQVQKVVSEKNMFGSIMLLG